MEEAGIDVVLSGHDHSYARTEPLKGGKVDKDNGLSYFICGDLGEKSRNLNYKAVDNEDFHFAYLTQEYDALYMLADATKDKLTISAYNVDGVLLDSFTKEKPVDPIPDPDPKPDPDPDPEPKPILPILPSGGQSAWKNPYQDVTDSSSYYEAVRYVTEKGLMNGTSASTFSPDAAMTRAMMVTILWRMEKEPAALKSNFTDLTADWYRTAVDWAAETGVVNGVGNGKFAPNATLSLEQLITILYRYAENKGYNVSKSASLDSFTDGSAVSAYAKPAMQWAVGMNFLSGNTLTPGAPASRAQIAQVLMLFCKAYIK